MKNFAAEIRAHLDVEQFLNQAQLMLDLQETNMESILDCMLRHLLGDEENATAYIEAKKVLFTRDAGKSIVLMIELNERKNEQTIERTNERTNDWTNERTNEQTNERTNFKFVHFPSVIVYPHKITQRIATSWRQIVVGRTIDRNELSRSNVTRSMWKSAETIDV